MSMSRWSFIIRVSYNNHPLWTEFKFNIPTPHTVVDVVNYWQIIGKRCTALPHACYYSCLLQSLSTLLLNLLTTHILQRRTATPYNASSGYSWQQRRCSTPNNTFVVGHFSSCPGFQTSNLDIVDGMAGIILASGERRRHIYRWLLALVWVTDVYKHQRMSRLLTRLSVT